MKVTLQKVSKRFGAQKVLKSVELSFPKGSITGLTGPNGSGKSTLLQIVAGSIKPDSGQVLYEFGNTKIEEDQIFRHVSISAPYLALYDDLSLGQALKTHLSFAQKSMSCSSSAFFQIVKLAGHEDKAIHSLSSGMLQRFKLGLAMLGNEALVLLDEPSSNLDQAGIEWMNELFEKYLSGRTVLICSNRSEEELKICDRVVDITTL